MRIQLVPFRHYNEVHGEHHINRLLHGEVDSLVSAPKSYKVLVHVLVQPRTLLPR